MKLLPIVQEKSQLKQAQHNFVTSKAVPSLIHSLSILFKNLTGLTVESFQFHWHFIYYPWRKLEEYVMSLYNTEKE